MQDLSPNDIETLLGAAGDPAHGIYMAEIRQLGGALARQPEDAMPFGFRQATLYLSLLAVAPSPDALAGGKRSIAILLQALSPRMTGEVILALAGDAGPELTRAAYSPDNYRRLVALKDRYDPQNIFPFNHNIPPSSHASHDSQV